VSLTPALSSVSRSNLNTLILSRMPAGKAMYHARSGRKVICQSRRAQLSHGDTCLHNTSVCAPGP
jgi:hypothetical protein